MTVQRHFRQDAVVYPMQTVTDNRDQEIRVVNMDNPIPVKAAFVFPTGVGVTMHIYPLPEGFDAGSRVEWAGGRYNAGPPAYHHGPARATRHWSVELVRTS